MNFQPQNDIPESDENVLAGLVGAFLFALAGGLCWYLFYLIGMLSAISGIVGTICAIKGYEIFAKKISVKGIVFSVILAFLVLVIAWYFTFASDLFEAYKIWYQEGEIDFEASYSFCLRVGPEYLLDPEIGISYFIDLGLGLVFAVIGCIPTVRNALAAAKNANNAYGAPEYPAVNVPPQNFSGAEYFAPSQNTSPQDIPAPEANPNQEATSAENIPEAQNAPQTQKTTPAESVSAVEKPEKEDSGFTPPPYDPNKN